MHTFFLQHANMYCLRISENQHAIDAGVCLHSKYTDFDYCKLHIKINSKAAKNVTDQLNDLSLTLARMDGVTSNLD